MAAGTQQVPSQFLLPVAIRAMKTLREQAGLIGVVPKDMQNIPVGVGETETFGYATDLSVGTLTPGAYLSAFPTQSTWKYKQVALSAWVKTEWGLDARDYAKIANMGIIPRQQDQKIRAMANYLKASALTAAKKANGLVWTAQSEIVNSTDLMVNLAAIRTRLSWQLCPSDRLVLVLDPDSIGALRAYPQFVEADKAGDAFTFRIGAVGRIYGMAVLEDNGGVLPYTWTGGTGGSYVINGTHAAGATSVVVKTGSGTILAGDVITITAAADGIPRHYNVVTGITAAGTLVIAEPGLQVALADSDVVAVLGKSGGYKVRGFAFDPDMIGLLGRIPQIPGALGAHRVIEDNGPEGSGLMLKLSELPCDEAVIYRASLLFGMDNIDPRLGVKVATNLTTA